MGGQSTDATPVRISAPGDADGLVSLRAAIWPDVTPEEHNAEIRAILTGTPRSTLPLVLFVAEVEGRLVGFAEVGLRSHADGCDPSRPVGFIEGWYVAGEHRGKGIGRSLIQAAENWCRTEGCVELASDTWFDNKESQQVHEALGFQVVDRCVNYRKDLRQ